jgi:hypothetical protein
MPDIEIRTLTSDNGNYILALETGNLVLRDKNKNIIWTTGLEKSMAVECYMREDGNLVLNNSKGIIIWQTKTNGNKGAKIILQDNRNLVIQDINGRPLWSSGTSIYYLEETDEANPILLFPLRIETRFVKEGTELWIRVFPDEVAIHQHENDLTESEQRGGNYYWKNLYSIWNSVTGEAYKNGKKKNWGQLVNHFGVNRAKWIIKQTRPKLLTKEDDFSAVRQANGDISYDPIKIKQNAWSQAATCRLMPDFLQLTLYHANENVAFQTTGNPIPNPLPMGPDPQFQMQRANPDLDWDGTPIAWMENFEEAVKIGMGFKVLLSSVQNYDPTKGFGKLLIFGVKTDSLARTDPAVMGKAALNELFESHVYSPKGFAFVKQGTPTNNTEENKSGFNEQTSFSEELYQSYHEMQLPAASGNNASLFARALAIDPALLNTAENANAIDASEATAMNLALYPATLGFYLENLLHYTPVNNNKGLFNRADLDALQFFFSFFVSGRGPLSAFRIGDQPYGILPTSDFDNFRWRPFGESSLVTTHLYTCLQRLNRDFDNLVGKVSKLGQPGKPHEILDQILGLYPNSEAFFQRVGYSEDFLQNFFDKTVATTPGRDKIFNLLGRLYSAVDNPQWPDTPEGVLQLSKIVYEKDVTALDRNRLVDILPASETGFLTVPTYRRGAGNYIKWLLKNFIQEDGDLEKNYFSGEDKPPLLYLLLRHALLLTLSKEAFNWLRANGELPAGLELFARNNNPPSPDFIAGKEFFNLFNEDIAPLALLSIDNKLLKGKLGLKQITLGQYLLMEANRPQSLINFFGGLKLLQEFTSASLERSFIEHLDCLTYRLDAWQTGFFYSKLEATRNKGVIGTCIGAYGWLENLKAKPVPVSMMLTDLPIELRPTNGLPIIAATDLGGYIQAPSIGQAKAAALMRNGYLNYHEPANSDLMAVNLTSDRVRKALHLFEGVQQEQPIELLLGYRFERFLHENRLDQYISAFRSSFPYVTKTIPNPDGTDNPPNPETTSAQKPISMFSLLNGKAIADTIKNGNGYPANIPLGSTTIIQQGVDDLIDCLDAMKDLLVAESIYQLTQGNMERAGALFKSIRELKPPPAFEYTETPRTAAHVLTNRACVMFNGDLSPASFTNPWPDIPLTPRAEMEPSLNEWLAGIIGQPDNIVCVVSHKNANGDFTNPQDFTLNTLLLQAIDLIYIMEDKLGAENSELALRIGYAYKRKYFLPDNTILKIAYGLETATSEGKVWVAEVFPLLSRLKKMITNARPLNASDFDLQSYSRRINSKNLHLKIQKNGQTYVKDIGHLYERKTRAENRFRSNNVLTAIDPGQGVLNVEVLRSALLEISNFGIPNAFPKSAYGNTNDQFTLLRQQADTVYHYGKELIDKMSQFDTLFFTTPINGLDNIDALTTQLTENVKLLFGTSFNILPRFHFTAENPDEEVDRIDLLSAAISNENKLFEYGSVKPPFIQREGQIQQWINDVGRVRVKLENFEMVRTLSGAFQGIEPAINILQLPFENGDSWLGQEFPETQNRGKAKLSMMVCAQNQNLLSQNPSSGSYCGLLIDEWVEEIPGKEETTGITFQYDQPNSRPPQTLLLAISPTEGGKWNWDKLAGILNDTLNRAKKRGIDPELIATTAWGGVLPAVISEFSETKGNVSLFFRDNIKTTEGSKK